MMKRKLVDLAIGLCGVAAAVILGLLVGSRR